MSEQIEATRTEPGARAAAQLPALAINGRFFGQEMSGVQRYGREAVNALDRLLAERDSDSRGKHAIFVPTNVPEEAWPQDLRSFQVCPVGCLSGHPWEQAELPWHARRFLLLSLTNSAPLLHPRQVVTIHDAAIKAHPGDFRWQYRAW